MKRVISIISLFLASLFFAQNTFCASLDVSSFTDYPSVITAKLSPSGRFIVYVYYDGDSESVALGRVNSPDKEILFLPDQYVDGDAYVTDIEWLDNRYIAAQLTEEIKGIEELISTKIQRRLIVIDTKKNSSEQYTIASVRTKGWFVGAKPEEPYKFLYARSTVKSKIYEIDVRKLHEDKQKLNKLDRIDGGQFVSSNVVTSVDNYVISWFVDQNYDAQAALTVDRELTLRLLEKVDDNEFLVVKEWAKDKRESAKEDSLPMFSPQEKAAEPYTYYSTDLNSKDRRKVYKVNFKTDESSVVFETAAYEIVSVIVDADRQLAAVVVKKDGRLEYEFVHKDGFKAMPNKDLDVVIGQSLDKTKFLSYTESHNIPGYFYMMDKVNGKRRVVASRYHKLPKKLASETRHGFTRVGELDIPWLLSHPTPRKKYPLVVMPHGGPIGVHDDPYYDPYTQLFVSRGYAVLRINYRGSSGFSREYEEAGKKEFGKGILSDIKQATMSVLDDKYVDKNRVCIVGMSYGGYAALSLLTDNPSLFKCGASIAGVADVSLYLRSDALTETQRKWAKEYIGDGNQDYDELKLISPLYRLGNLSRPLFVAHGSQDSIVDIEHAYRIKYVLDKAGKSFQWYVDEESGHQFSDQKNRAELFRRLTQFVKENI